MSTTRTRLIACSWLVLGAVACLAHAAGNTDSKIRLAADEIAALPAITTGPGTSGLASIRTTILAGDPLQEGPYTIALLVPANTYIAAHQHRDARSVVVVSGQWYFGYGNEAGDSVKLIGPGGFYTEPADVAHFARTGSMPATVYISGFGPTDTRYIDAPTTGR